VTIAGLLEIDNTDPVKVLATTHLLVIISSYSAVFYWKSAKSDWFSHCPYVIAVSINLLAFYRVCYSQIA